MEALPEDVREFLAQHPELELVPGKKVRFTVTGHELPCRLLDLQKFIAGKKYKNLMEVSFDGSKYEPHIIPSTKNKGQLFCKLTVRHIAKRLEDVQRHINGSRYQRALQKYEECQKLGVEYVPTCLQNKSKQRKLGDEQQAGKKEQMWELDNSGAEDSDSSDSMSDLYPAHMFTKKTIDGENGEVKSDSNEEMEVEESVNNSQRKRPQKQTGPALKKLKSHHKKSKNTKTSSKK
ncbi:PREDICTED: surfeit locus protein 2 [Nanorana parkeri]|uniref:surfeit locus protein 2 n=1 Tax=Nanorana parkeri TaxID=125878 RepID=UPI00085469D2|nr:PREDICTED: surfeit locus protein 2 [Nanorana parkeri]